MRKPSLVNLAMVVVVLLFAAFNFFAFRAAEDGFNHSLNLQSTLTRPSTNESPAAQIGVMPFLLATESEPAVKPRRKGRSFKQRGFGRLKDERVNPRLFPWLVGGHE